MEYENQCLPNYAELNETPFKSFFLEIKNNQNEKGFLEDSYEKNIIMKNPSHNTTSNTTFNNIPNVSSNNDSNINLNYISLNKYNNFSINTSSNEYHNFSIITSSNGYNNFSINISSNEYNNFSINSNEEKEEVEITDVFIDNQDKMTKKREKKEKKDKKSTKKGRKKKEEIMNCITKRNKYAKDNIFRKLKTYSLNKFLVSYINKKIKCVYKKQKYIVRKFNKALVIDVSILFNIDLFNSNYKKLIKSRNFKQIFNS